MKFKVTPLFHVLIYDIGLGVVHIGVDILLVYHYLHKDNGDGSDNGWAAATISAIFLPGLLEAAVYIYSYLHGDLEGSRGAQLRELFSWLFFSLFFPVSMVVWHTRLALRGESHFLRYENAARSRVLNSLSVLTKSALQLGLQTYIIMSTWHKPHESSESSALGGSYESKIIPPILSASFSLLMLAKSGTDHHYFESSGKDVHARPAYMSYLGRLLCNIFHLLARTLVSALLASYLQALSFVFVAAMIVINFVTATLVLRTERAKNVFTCFAATLLPTCFVARDTIKGKEVEEPKCGPKLFARFYKYNSIQFLLVSTIALVTACLMLRFSPDLPSFTCEDLPLLSYDPDCQHNIFSNGEVLGMSQMHSWFFLLGSILVLLLSSLDAILVFLTERNETEKPDKRRSGKKTSAPPLQPA